MDTISMSLFSMKEVRGSFANQCKLALPIDLQSLRYLYPLVDTHRLPVIANANL
jgi:hypothetical protein